ncbi:MAG: molybdopterin/thiamine biosynthesis adenylyltransferase/rhodanese-related sulfurtransferase [Kiritimatiellia bacterium]|jgi:molybdopterin/thiamine biosynthesis adenylyltransferase/rhodanese-related sulfurtransferase
MPTLPDLSSAERDRYSRHLLLNQVGETGQRKLKAARILVIGAGGLGSPALLYLAAAGVGTLGLVEFDNVEASNLQRQILYSTADVGTPKAPSAKRRLSELNPHVNVVVHPERLDSSNALRILQDYHIILDGTDNFPTRYLINDACELLGLPFVYGAIQRFEGQVAVFNYQGGPTYRDLFSEPPPPGLAPSCAEAGVLGVLPGIIGVLQATEALKLVLGAGRILSGRLILYDALNMRFDELQIVRDPGRAPVVELIDYLGFCGLSPKTANWTRLSAEQVQNRREQGWTPYVLDVRTAAEAATASLPFTDRQHTHQLVHEIIHDLPQAGDLLIYCARGGRSAHACRALIAAGIDKGRIFDLVDGLQGWG